MKLNIASNKKEMDTRQKVNEIMGSETTTNETENKGIKKMKLKIKGSETTTNETSKPKKLTLKKSQGLNSDNIELSTEKFAQVETILNRLNNIDSTFTEFLSNQNESISVLNSFTKRIDTFETILTNSIKNQKSILNAINSLNAKFKNVGNFYNPSETTTNETKSNESKVETKLIKGKHKKENTDIETIDGIYEIFQSYFGNKNFMGSQELTSDTLPIFQDLFESLDIDSIDTCQKSINDFRSKLTKEKNKYMTARKSNRNFDNAIFKTVKQIEPNFNDSLDNSQKESTVIDKNYFVSLFNTDIETINDLIDESKNHGSIDNELIEALTSYIESLKPNVSDNQIGQFVKYIREYLKS